MPTKSSYRRALGQKNRYIKKIKRELRKLKKEIKELEKERKRRSHAIPRYYPRLKKRVEA